MDDTTHCTGCGTWLGTDCHSELLELRRARLDVEQLQRIHESDGLVIDQLSVQLRDQRENVSQILHLRREADDRNKFVKELTDTINANMRVIQQLRGDIGKALQQAYPLQTYHILKEALEK